MADPDFDKVVLLCHFDGTDGATSATDVSNSAHTLTFNDSAQIDTADSKFGGASLSLDGTAGSYVEAPDSADWRLSAANGDQFTVEAFVKVSTVSKAFQVAVCQWNTSSNRSWALFIENSTVVFYWSTTTDDFPNLTSGSGAISADTWHHLAADKDGTGKVRLYVDGVKVDDATPVNSAFPDVSIPLRIGQDNNTARALDGWIDEVRITKGLARYATDAGFTPPTAPFEGGEDSGVTGAGTLEADASAATGAGTSGSTGSGTPAAGNATASGAGASGSVGTGGLSSGGSTVEGSGTAADPEITGTGTLEASGAAVEGSGVSGSTGTVTLAGGAATASGEGVSGSTGTGSLSSTATVEGAGESGTSGSGDLEAGASVVSGTAANIITGSGELVAGDSDAGGVGTSGSTGSGSPAASAAATEGGGSSGSTGTGALVIAFPTISGAGTSGSTGSGALVANDNEVSGSDAETGTATPRGENTPGAARGAHTAAIARGPNTPAVARG